MGGRSSKSNKPDHVNYMEDIQQSYYEDKTILHEGPIHTICSVNENLIVSGGADKVFKRLFNWKELRINSVTRNYRYSIVLNAFVLLLQMMNNVVRRCSTC